MADLEYLASGWCCLWQTCMGIGVPCVRHPERGEYCVRCWARVGPAERGGPAAG